MKHLRVIDEAGNRHDYDTEFVPRIGERIVLTHGIGGSPVVDHYSRVQDVQYRLDASGDNQVAVLIEEEQDGKPWPS